MSKSKVIRFSIRLWGDELIPKTVTNRLGIEPTYAYEKGYKKNLSSGKTAVPRELGIWVYEHVVHTSFESELSSLLDQFNENDLKTIDGVQIAILDLYFGLSDDQSIINESFECLLDNKTILKLSDLGLDVRITVS